jgi:hypothetical protein
MSITKKIIAVVGATGTKAARSYALYKPKGNSRYAR